MFTKVFSGVTPLRLLATSSSGFANCGMKTTGAWLARYFSQVYIVWVVALGASVSAISLLLVALL